MSIFRVHKDETDVIQKATVGLISLFPFQSKGGKQKISLSLTLKQVNLCYAICCSIFLKLIFFSYLQIPNKIKTGFNISHLGVE